MSDAHLLKLERFYTRKPGYYPVKCVNIAKHGFPPKFPIIFESCSEIRPESGALIFNVTKPLYVSELETIINHYKPEYLHTSLMFCEDRQDFLISTDKWFRQDMFTKMKESYFKVDLYFKNTANQSLIAYDFVHKLLWLTCSLDMIFSLDIL